MLRYEYKYYVPFSKLRQVRSMLFPFMQLDKYAAENGGEYTVRSIYFDTPGFECYALKVKGIARRKKIRLRGYNKGGARSTVFFEIKKKIDNPMIKIRAPLAFEDAKSIFRGKQIEAFVHDSEKFQNATENARHFMHHIYSRNMKPVVTVIYEREAFESKYENKSNRLRITLDKNLRVVPYPTIEELYEEKSPQQAIRNCFILEVKFNNYLPRWVRTLLAANKLVKEPASKYVLSVDAHQAVNPYERFGSLLKGRFF